MKPHLTEKILAGNMVFLGSRKAVKSQDALTFTPGHGSFSLNLGYTVKKATNS